MPKLSSPILCTFPGNRFLPPYKIERFAEMGGVVGKGDTPRHSSAATKLEQKMVEAMQQRAQEGTSLRSFNSVIMKFPKIDESLRNCRIIFQQFGEYLLSPAHKVVDQSLYYIPFISTTHQNFKTQVENCLRCAKSEVDELDQLVN
jgi:hypothetical protein